MFSHCPISPDSELWLPGVPDSSAKNIHPAIIEYFVPKSIDGKHAFSVKDRRGLLPYLVTKIFIFRLCAANALQ